MSLIAPLGLLGLLGLAVLLLIYLLKPNYQQKVVSSTFIWNLSLKYRKKKVPISKFRDIIILICQILIIALLAFIMTRPIIPTAESFESNEKIIVLDASASMHTKYNNEMRFERAVSQIQELVNITLSEDEGTVSIIIADNEPEFLFHRVGADKLEDINAALHDLLFDEAGSYSAPGCTYGVADIDAAMELAQEVIETNPTAEVYLYTGTEYLNKGDVTVVDVSDAREWNVAIVDCYTQLDDGYYSVYVDLACYGRDVRVSLECDVKGASLSGGETGVDLEGVWIHDTIDLKNDEVVTVVFSCIEETGDYLISYNSLTVSILSEQKDCLDFDDEISLYSNTKTIRVLYSSTTPNQFFSDALMSVQNAMRSSGDSRLLDITEDRSAKGVNAGYDFYIYEHYAPAILPADGVVFLCDVQSYDGIGFALGERSNIREDMLSTGEDHPITSGMRIENISVTQYVEIKNIETEYSTLMYYLGMPIVVACNEPNQKIVIMSFSLNNSNFAIMYDFPTMIYNMFEYYIPVTFSSNLYEVNDTITFTSRGSGLEFKGVDNPNGIVFDTSPVTVKVTQAGVYTVSQNVFKKDLAESFYVHVAFSESNINRVEDKLNSPDRLSIERESDFDLIVFFAAALVLLLLVEWWLYSRGQRI